MWTRYRCARRVKDAPRKHGLYQIRFFAIRGDLDAPELICARPSLALPQVLSRYHSFATCFVTNMSKRAGSPTGQGALIKRTRESSPGPTNQIAISSSNDERQQALIRTVKRTSSLEAPIISLSGSHGVRQTFHIHLCARTETLFHALTGGNTQLQVRPDRPEYRSLLR